MKQIEVEGGRSRAEGKRVKGGGQRRHMSTLIEKNTGQHPHPHPFLVCSCSCCSFTGQRTYCWNCAAQLQRSESLNPTFSILILCLHRWLDANNCRGHKKPGRWRWRRRRKQKVADTTYQIKTHLMRNKDNRMLYINNQRIPNVISSHV